jgi:ATP-dependent DNA helicase DinG
VTSPSPAAAASTRTAGQERVSVEELLEAAVGAVPGGVDRPGQRTMARAVADAAEHGEHLLVQAGTGTGKSLAYLVPALLVAPPVVVSTATLALQHQLIDSDLPRLADAVAPLLGRRPTFAVLKGRHHYLCLAKLDGANADEPPQDGLFDAAPDPTGSKGGWLGEAGKLGKQMQRVREWAEQTATGDRDELDPGVDDTLWRGVSMPARECVGAMRCPFGDECFAEASRVRAREVDIVVTNHSLLAFDMLAGRHIIPNHRLLVVDEAHELADRVSSASQAELTPDLLDRAARRTRSYVDADTAQLLQEAADALAVGLADAAPGRVTHGLPVGIGESLTLVDSGTKRALDRIGEIKADDPDPVRKQQARGVLSELNTTAQRMLAESAFDVTWIDRDDRRRAIVVAPLSVAPTLTTHLYDDRTVVATSATLALGGRFETIAAALGLPPHPGDTTDATTRLHAAAQRAVQIATDSAAATATDGTTVTDGTTAIDGTTATDGTTVTDGTSALTVHNGSTVETPAAWRAIDVGSPFDYTKQGILYVAAHLPRPTASGLSEPAAQELLRLVDALGGRTLGLFSSRRAAERAAEVLRAHTALDILVQGEEALPLLVRRFRGERNSCLLGVMSLWQGVDVPGDACQLVVIDRLPFPRPDEPLAAARSAAVDAAGGSGFAAVSVPIAAVRLAQGVGRLIRTATDRGVVAVLDSRLETARGYGQFLRRSLPPFWYTTNPEVVGSALRRLAATEASTGAAAG